MFPNRIISQDPYIRIDDIGTYNEHVHIKYNNKKYSWYKSNGNNRHGDDNGLEDVSKSMKKKLIDSGLPEDYFKLKQVTKPILTENYCFASMPLFRENLIKVEVKPYKEEIPIINDNSVDTQTSRYSEDFHVPEGVIYGGVALTAVALVALAFVTGGQSLWGLLLI